MSIDGELLGIAKQFALQQEAHTGHTRTNIANWQNSAWLLPLPLGKSKAKRHGSRYPSSGSALPKFRLQEDCSAADHDWQVQPRLRSRPNWH